MGTRPALAAVSLGSVAKVTAGSSNTYTESITALRAAVLGALGLTVSYTIQNNTDVVPGVEKTDTITAVGLDYEF